MKNATVYFFTLCILPFFSCTNDKIKEEIDYVWGDGTVIIDENNLPSNPQWLKIQIDSMSKKDLYVGTKIDLYFWSNKFYYLINIPYSKSTVRDLYTVGGQKVYLMPDKLADFYKSRSFKNNIWTDNRLTYEPTDVIVKTKSLFSIEKVFDFINSFQYEVEYLDGCVYRSSLPPDSLSYVLNYLNAKTYTKSNGWCVTGYLHYQTKIITIFPRLFWIKNKAYQSDWINSMNTLKLSNNSNNSYEIFFHVPFGEELEWAKRFACSDSIDWAEVNMHLNVILHDKGECEDSGNKDADIDGNEYNTMVALRLR